VTVRPANGHLKAPAIEPGLFVFGPPRRHRNLLCPSVDTTGGGRPVVDIFRKAGLRPTAVTITAGDAQTRERLSPSDYKVAKILLVSRLQAYLHSGQLKIAKDLPETRALVEELQDFQVSFTETGYAKFGARVGRHDDLVLSAAIALWWAFEHKQTTTRVRPLPVG
jgi:hypothetical protein